MSITGYAYVRRLYFFKTLGVFCGYKILPKAFSSRIYIINRMALFLESIQILLPGVITI